MRVDALYVVSCNAIYFIKFNLGLMDKYMKKKLKLQTKGYKTIEEGDST